MNINNTRILKKFKIKKIIILTIIILLFILLSALYFFYIKNTTHVKKVDIYTIKNNNLLKNNEYEEKEKLKIAIAPVISPKTSLFIYNDFMQYISKKINQQIEIIQGTNYGYVNELLKNSLCDIAFICTGAYIVTKNNNMSILVLPVVKNETVYYSYIITHKDSNIKNFFELQGKSFAFTDPLSLSGFFYPRYLIKQKNKTIRQFFSKIIFTHSHDDSIRAVIQKLVDGAAVDSLVYDKISKDKILDIENTRIIHKSQPFCISPVVVRANLENKKISELRKILIDMHNDEEGKNILKKIDIDKFVIPTNDIYRSLEKISELAQ